MHSPRSRPWSRWNTAVAALLLASGPAHGSEIAATVGGTVTGSSEWSGTAYLDATGGRFHTLGIEWRPLASLGWIGEHHGAPPQRYPDVAVAAIGARVADATDRHFFAFQVGLASRRTPAISSHLQFVTTLGWQRGRMVLMLRHISNGRLLSGPNHGETMLLVGATL